MITKEQTEIMEANFLLTEFKNTIIRKLMEEKRTTPEIKAVVDKFKKADSNKKTYVEIAKNLGFNAGTLWEIEEKKFKVLKANSPEGKKLIETIGQAKEQLMACFIEYFADENGDTWTKYKDDNKIRFCQIESQQFYDFVRVKLDEDLGIPKESWIEPLIKLFDSIARRTLKKKLHVRLANHDGAWYVQLSENSSARIRGGTVKIVESPTIFRTYSNQIPHKIDLTANIEDINLLDKYTNFKDKSELEYFKDKLPGYLVPDISKPIVLYKGGPGSSKTTQCRLITRIIDPNSSMMDGIPFPEDERDWFSVCREHSFLFIDNVNTLNRKQQDNCSRYVTGTNVKQRKLYTNFGIVQSRIKAAMCINALDLSGLQADFLDRSDINELERIEDDMRIGEEELMKSFEQDLPKIMGAILKILAKAKEMYPNIKSPDSLRLKDFARYAAACAAARGRKSEDFLEALKLKAELQKDESIAQSIIAQPLLNFMENSESWDGTPTELLKDLTKQEYGVIEGHGEHETVRIKNVPRYWPQNPALLSKELTKIAHLLKYHGIKFERIKTKKGRIIKFTVFTVHP